MQKNDPLWIACDKLWSDCVRLKANGLCQFCKKRPGTGAHHIIPRGYTATAFLVENGVWLCAVCHNDDIELDSRGLFLIGGQEYTRLWEIANKVTQLRYADLVLIRERLRKERDEYERISD
jgi:hypothetical protein